MTTRPHNIEKETADAGIRYSNRSGLHRFFVVTYEFFMQCVFALPRYRLFNWVKACFLRLRGAKIGRRVVFYPGAWITTGKNLVVGDDVDIALDVIITTGEVTIGPRTLIGYRTQIISTNHVIPDGRERIFASGSRIEAIHIGSDVWIGANCLILAGVTIGEGAVVAGGSVVTKSVEPFTIVGGNPARLIRKRTIDDQEY